MRVSAKVHRKLKNGLTAGIWRRPLGPGPLDVFVDAGAAEAERRAAFAPPTAPPAGLRRMFRPPECTEVRASRERPSLLEAGAAGDAYADFEPRQSFRATVHAHFYLGHMQKRSAEILRLIKSPECHLIVDVRDARAAFTTGNEFVTSALPREKPRLVVLNKADLVRPADLERVAAVFRAVGLPCVTTRGDDRRSAERLREEICRLARPRWRSLGRKAVFIGMPNVGKSTLLNALRSEIVALAYEMGSPGLLHMAKNIFAEKTLKCSGEACTTRRVLPFKIAHEPRIFGVDTPGLGLPATANRTTALKLAALRIYPLTVVPARDAADYILYALNARREFRYVDRLFLSRPTNDINDLGAHIHKLLNMDAVGPIVNMHTQWEWFVAQFNAGHLGEVILDRVPRTDSGAVFRRDAPFLLASEPPSPFGASGAEDADEVVQYL